MKNLIKAVAALALPLTVGATQAQVVTTSTSGGEVAKTPAETTTVKKADNALSFMVNKPIVIQHIRPGDARGINVFEPPKTDAVAYTGFKLDWGAAFTQQWQGLQHENTANQTAANQLVQIGHGFNNAVANLYLNAQIAPGIRVAMESYLSARHHQESWVKDGYALIDQSPIDVPLFNTIMKYTTLKIGHFEINYGDEHFRRTDNGNGLYNPFVGNFITDAFTTEIGAEAYVRANGFLAMASVTGGEVKGQVTAAEKRAPSFIAKLGYDKQLDENLRVRLTGSMYKKDRSNSNTLFSGDRAGSRYYDVLENIASTETANAWSGELRPGFGSRVTAFVVNPFVRFYGLELFANVETATGQNWSEDGFRAFQQQAGEVLYRFWNDKLYAGYRYNTSRANLVGISNTVNANRFQLAGGWYVSPMMLMKLEWVNQSYYGFPLTDIRNGGQFKGFMWESSLAF